MPNCLSRLVALVVAPAIGVIVGFRSTIFSGFRFVQGHSTDTGFSNYILEHGYRWVIGNELHSNFWNAPFFWPLQNTAAYAETLIGSAPLYWAARAVGFMPDTSYQLWMMACLILDYYAALFFLRKGLRLSWLPAVAGSFVFGFGYVRITRLAAPQVLPQFASILALYCVFRFFQNTGDRAKARAVWIWLFAACVAFQIYCGVYLSWFFCFGLAVFVGVAALSRESRPQLIGLGTNHWGAILFGALVAAMALYWPASHYVEALHEHGSRGWPEVFSMVPRWWTWFSMGNSYAYEWLNNWIDHLIIPQHPELSMGVGPITLGVAIYGLIKNRAILWVRLLSISFLVVVLLAQVYPFEITPWKLVWSLFPGAGAIRVVARVELLLLIPMSIGVALGFSLLKDRRWVFVLLALVCVEQVENIGYYDKHAMRSDIRAIAQKIRPDCRSFFWMQRIGPNDKADWTYKYQVDAMWAGLEVNKPTLNGYSAQFPIGWPLHNAILRSQVDLMSARDRVYQWAAAHGLNTDEIALPWTGEKNLPFWAPRPTPDKNGNLTLEFGGPYARACLGVGWGGDAPDHVWVIGVRSVAYVPLEEGSSYDMLIEAHPLRTPGKVQWMDIVFNDEPLKRITLSGKKTIYRVPVPKRLTKEANKIVFSFAYAEAPSALGKSSDHRKLSVCFFSMRFAKLD